MWNYCNTVKIKILFEGKIAEFNCYYKNTIKQIIQQYINSFLNPSYNLNSFSLTINNKICLLESTLETYINDISINNIFFLSYNYNKVNNNNTLYIHGANFMPHNNYYSNNFINNNNPFNNNDQITKQVNFQQNYDLHKDISVQQNKQNQNVLDNYGNNYYYNEPMDKKNI